MIFFRPLAYFLIVIDILLDVECGLLKNQSSSDVNDSLVYLNGNNKEMASPNYPDTQVNAPRKKDKGGDMMSKILPMMVMPFMISTAIIPMMLMKMKFMLIKSAILGGLAVILMLVNMLRGRNDGGGVYSHEINSKDLAMAHYGYGGDEEYGAYVNKRAFR